MFEDFFIVRVEREREREIYDGPKIYNSNCYIEKGFISSHKVYHPSSF